MRDSGERKRILVFGGRDYSDHERLFEVLDQFLEVLSSVIIIHGGARGADSLAGEWARDRDQEEIVFLADWNKYSKAAGYKRNIQMLHEGHPDLVVAFPGGKGTDHMIMIAENSNVMVVKVLDKEKSNCIRVVTI